MKKIIIFSLVFLILLSLSIRGKAGDPVFYQNEETRDIESGSPFENSGSASRYVLTEAIAESRSFIFTKEQSFFAAPDISAFRGKTFSIFNPGVSFIGLPLYMLGKFIGVPQLAAFYTVTVFAVINLIMIFFIARRIGCSFYPSLIAGFIYLFATNSYVYAHSFTQHIMTTTTILLAMLLALRKNSVVNNILLGITVGASLFMDLVNIIMLSPILIYVFIKHFKLYKYSDKIKISFNPAILAFIPGIIPVIAGLGLYYYQLTGSYTSIPQFIGNAQITESSGVRQNLYAEKNVETIKLPFQSRRLMEGFYALLISEERSWLYYSPVLFLGAAGFILIYKKQKIFVIVGSSVVLINILSYAMFIDPWGGWAFGARYLIPGSAIVSIGIAPLLGKFGRNFIFVFIFFALTTYSVYINTLGANTTATIPPKIEAEQLSEPTTWGIQYNYDFLEKNLSGSLIYNLYLFPYVNPRDYITILTILNIFVLSGVYFLMYKNTASQKESKI